MTISHETAGGSGIPEPAAHSKSAESEGHPEGAVTFTAEQQTELRKFIQHLTAAEQLSQTQRQEIEKSYEQAQQESVYWKFQYLNCFFVPTTKTVLNWFNTNPGQSRAAYDALWGSMIPDKGSRDATFDALSQNNMILDDSGMINVTPEGVLFLQWLTSMHVAV